MARAMSLQPTDPSYEQRVRASFARQPFREFLGAQLLTARPGQCEVALPYKRELSQQYDFFHAGIIGTIVDNTAGYAAYFLMHEWTSKKLGVVWRLRTRTSRLGLSALRGPVQSLRSPLKREMQS